MANFTNAAVPTTNNSTIRLKKFFAVYDPCTVNDTAGSDLAFIEERLYSPQSSANDPGDEKYFPSLKDAKTYVKAHFNHGAEYFSLNQSVDPDNLLHIILDKITYMVC